MASLLCPALRRGIGGSLLRNKHEPWTLQKRASGSIRVMEDKRSGEETVYFRKEDDVLLRNLLANHPEYDPKYSFAESDSDFSSLGRDVHLVCQKHGMKYTSLAFLKDICNVFESHGWSKPASKPK